MPVGSGFEGNCEWQSNPRDLRGGGELRERKGCTNKRWVTQQHECYLHISNFITFFIKSKDCVSQVAFSKYYSNSPFNDHTHNL